MTPIESAAVSRLVAAAKELNGHYHYNGEVWMRHRQATDEVSALLAAPAVAQTATADWIKAASEEIANYDCEYRNTPAERIAAMIAKHAPAAADDSKELLAAKDAELARIHAIAGGNSDMSPEQAVGRQAISAGELARDLNRESGANLARAEKAEAVLAEAQKDSAIIDWVDNECFTLGTDGEKIYVVRASDGENFFGDTLREAVSEATSAASGRRP